MKNRCLVAIFPILMIISAFGDSPQNASKELTIESAKDLTSQYRDTLVGKFNGIDIDTLVCEPAGKLIKDNLLGEFYTEWRVYTVKGTVDDLMIGNTFSIKFVEEGDLDGNNTEEWGYVANWNSSLTEYELFTVVDGKWRLMVDPIIVWGDHLETSFTENDIAKPSDKAGFIQIKTSNTIGEDIYWIVVDTIVPINPQPYSYELVEW